MAETIGKKWRERQIEAGALKERQTRGEFEAAQRREAEAIIATAPTLIEAAEPREKSVRLFGWMTGWDVPGTDKERVDGLAAALQEQDRPLRADDLAGRARLVFDWCDANDLECFLVMVDIPQNEPEYDFHVRPKAE